MSYSYPKDLKYSESHEWVRLLSDDNHVLIGITDHVPNLYGEVDYIDLPEIREVEASEEIGTLELSQGEYEFYSPVSGELIEINEELIDAPKLINTDPYGDGWICKVKLADPTELEYLMSAEEYKNFLTTLEER